MLIVTALALGATASCAMLLMIAKNAPLAPECYDSCGKLNCPSCSKAARPNIQRVDNKVHDRSDVLSDLSA